MVVRIQIPRCFSAGIRSTAAPPHVLRPVMVHVVPLAEGREVGAGVVGHVVGEGPRSSLLLPLPTAFARLVGLMMPHGASGRSPGFAVPGHMTGNAA